MKKQCKRVTAILLVCLMFFSSVVFAGETDDITGTFFETEFRQAVERGWILGFTDGSFRPDAYITRAEFITLLDNVLSFPDVDNTDIRFLDVDENHWFFETLLKYQYAVNLLTDNTFEANRPITREEVSYIIFNIIETDITLAEAPFNDSFQISVWAYQAVNTLQSLGILLGNPSGYFEPRRNITRAEAVIILTRLYQSVAVTGLSINPEQAQQGQISRSFPEQITLDDIRYATGPAFQYNANGRDISFIGGTWPQGTVHTFEDALWAMHSVSEMLGIYNAFEEFELIRIDPGNQRFNIGPNFHLRQVHMGVPIIGRFTNIGTDFSGHIRSFANGYNRYIRYAITTVEPSLSVKEANVIAMEYGFERLSESLDRNYIVAWGGRRLYLDGRTKRELVIDRGATDNFPTTWEEFYENMLPHVYGRVVISHDRRTNIPFLAWEVLAGIYRYEIDAHTGEMVHRESVITNFQGSGFGTQNTFREFTLFPMENELNNQRIYYMYDIDRNIRTYFPSDIENITDIGEIVYSYNPHEWYPMLAAVDGHFGAIQVFDFFYHILARNSVDNQGILITNTVGFDIINAFWWSRNVNGQNIAQIGFGTLPNGVSLAAALDVVGHEFAHGIVHFTANFGQSPLNEGWADILGQLFEMYMMYSSGDNASWIMGYSIDFPLRNLQNPMNLGHPIQFGGDNFLFPVLASLHSHNNSTVLSHLFYRFHTEVPFFYNRESVAAVEQSAQLWYSALRDMRPRGLPFDFFDARTSVMFSAWQLGIPFDDILHMSNIFDDSLVIIERYIRDGVGSERTYTARDQEPWSAWFFTPIMQALNIGILRGFPDRSVRPYQYMTRAEFITLVQNAMYYRPEPTVDSQPWYENIMALAYSLGWIGSIGGQDNPIQRDEAMHIIWSAFMGMSEENRGFFIPEISEGQLPNNWNGFLDVSDINPAYLESVFQMAYNRIVRGFPVNAAETQFRFEPTGTLRRAEASIIIMNMLNTYGGFAHYIYQGDF